MNRRRKITRSDSNNSPDSSEDGPVRLSKSKSRSNMRKRKTEVNYVEPDSDESVTFVSATLPTKSRGRPKKKIVVKLSSGSESAASSESLPVRKTRVNKAQKESTASEESFEEDDEKPMKSKRMKRTKKVEIKEEKEPETYKRIRKIMDEKELSENTKTAAAEEKERRQRIRDRQNKYNEEIIQAATESGEICKVATKLVLECDSDDKPLIEVAPAIIKLLKVHQIEAVKFLWECTMESLEAHQKGIEREKADPSASGGSGAILAHCMGLGKTLSTISFLHTILSHESVLHLKSALIVSPINAILNWHREWDMWQPADQPLFVQTLSNKLTPKERLDVVRKWRTKGGVLIMGYDMFRLLAECVRIRRKVDRTLLQEALLNPGPDFVVCDEGHLLKNESGRLSQTMRKIRTRRRIVLTGTPLQNNLMEYFTMVNFVKPQLLGTKQEFRNRFVNPIINGQHSSSTPHDVQVMKMRAHVLYKMLDGCVQRRDYSALTKYLPPKMEYLVRIRLTEVQRNLYSQYLEFRERAAAPGEKLSATGLFVDQQTFYRIWTHPFTLRMHEVKEAKKALTNFVCDDEEEEEDLTDSQADGSSSISFEEENVEGSKSCKVKTKKTCVVLDSDSDDNPDKYSDDDDAEEVEVEGKVMNGGRSSEAIKPTHKWATRSRGNVLTSRNKDKNVENGEESDEDAYLSELGPSTKPAWWHDIYQDAFEHRPELSGKMMMLFHILRKCADVGDKVLLFSQSLYSLDIIERFLQAMHIYLNETPEEKEERERLNKDSNEENVSKVIHQYDYSLFKSDLGINTWIKGLDYDRIDGSTSIQLRGGIQDKFNDPMDFRFRLFLISTKAGGLGINLVAANRCIVFDASWNPSHDIQSIFRCYRFGQIKPVYIYRLVAQGTMEEKIYDRQITKQSLAHRVIDEHQIERHFTEDDLQALYHFDPDIYNPDAPGELPKVPKDLVLADLLLECKELIVTYHDHDSLLENKVEEELTEAERQEAWKHFEEERVTGYSMSTRDPRALMNNSISRQSASFIQPVMSSGLAGPSASNFVMVPPGMTQEQAQTLYSNIALHVFNTYPALREMPTAMAQLIGQHYQQIVFQWLQQQDVNTQKLKPLVNS